VCVGLFFWGGGREGGTATDGFGKGREHVATIGGKGCITRQWARRCAKGRGVAVLQWVCLRQGGVSMLSCGVAGKTAPSQTRSVCVQGGSKQLMGAAKGVR
jgi:hypothetical protein